MINNEPVTNVNSSHRAKILKISPRTPSSLTNNSSTRSNLQILIPNKNQASLHFLDNTPTPLTASSPLSQLSPKKGISNSPFRRHVKQSLSVILGTSSEIQTPKSSQVLQNIQTRNEEPGDFEKMVKAHRTIIEHAPIPEKISQEEGIRHRRTLSNQAAFSPTNKGKKPTKAATLIDTNFEQRIPFMTPKSTQNLKKDPSWKQFSTKDMIQEQVTQNIFLKSLYKSQTMALADNNTTIDLKTNPIKDNLSGQSPQVKNTRRILRQISLSPGLNHQIQPIEGFESMRQSELPLSPQSKSKLAFFLKKPLELPGTGSMPYLERLVKRSQKPETFSSATEYTLLDKQKLMTSTAKRKIVKPSMSPEEKFCFASLQYTSQLSPTRAQKKISIYQHSSNKKFNDQDQQKINGLKNFAKETIVYGK